MAMTERRILVSQLQFQLNGKTFATGYLMNGEGTGVLRMGRIRYADSTQDALVYGRYRQAYLEEEDSYVGLALKRDRFIITEPDETAGSAGFSGTAGTAAADRAGRFPKEAAGYSCRSRR